MKLARTLAVAVCCLLSARCSQGDDARLEGAGSDRASESTSHVLERAPGSRAPLVPLARVEGYGNPKTGELWARSIPLPAGPTRTDGVQASAQALGFCAATVFADGVPDSNPPGTFEFYTRGMLPGAPMSELSSFDATTCYNRLTPAEQALHGPLVQSLFQPIASGVGCALQHVGNFSGVSYDHVYLDIDVFNGDEAKHAPYGPPYTTGTVGTPGGRNTPNAQKGLWDFGPMTNGALVNMWIYFKNGDTTDFNWTGYLVGERTETCGNAMDDDCDLVVDNGCSTFALGAACYAHADCGGGALCSGFVINSGFGQGGGELTDDVAGRCAICGDGMMHGTESCDDGDTTGGDGCSATCTVESGYGCSDMPSVCLPTGVCGDGALNAGEQCDPGPIGSPGCDSGCRIVSGYECAGQPSICLPPGVCGDGVFNLGEQCDPGATSFSVAALTVDNCLVQEGHSSITGDDRGGIAVGTARVLYSGDSFTGSFLLDDLSGTSLTSVPIRDGLVSDLSTGQVFAFGMGSTPFTSLTAPPWAFTSLLALNEQTGAVTGQVDLSSAISITTYGGGVFAGWGLVAIYASPDNGATWHVYTVDTATGAVADAGAIAPLSLFNCEGWAASGVAETLGGELHLLYVGGSNVIQRTRVSDGVTTTHSSFTSLSDMCSFGVSPATGRWYFHHEYMSQFTTGSDENIGFCNAAFAMTGSGCTGSCQVASGYDCAGEPSVCLPQGFCGDGVLNLGEQCDTGVTIHPGCASCLLVSGYECNGQPSYCTLEGTCGDGVLNLGEQCDPGAGGTPGCNGSCHIVPGYECGGEPSICLPPGYCGDGVFNLGEECDAGLLGSPGCDPGCQIVTGYECAGQPSVCLPPGVCGDGVLNLGEQCDPGAGGSPGCSGTCQVVSGYECGGEPSVCLPEGVCGDGVVNLGEQCDTGTFAFAVNSLTPNSCSSAEHASLTGDDRGGIAVGTSRVLYTGDNNTASFQLGNVGSGVMTSYRRDGIVSDLATGQVFTLATGPTPLSVSGGTPFVITTLLTLDEVTGTTGGQITLSSPINVTVPYAAGVFSGPGLIAIYASPDFGVTHHVYTINTATGTVIDKGPLGALSFFGCESWATWGVADLFNGELHLLYTGGSNSILRTRVSDGYTTAHSTFANLADMCSFSVSPGTGRWYFHHESPSQLAIGVDENIGYCDATFSNGSVSPACDTSCQIVAGYECEGEPSFCLPAGFCGDGVLNLGETCDDGGPPVSGDGCDDACTVEFGYDCPGEPSLCSAICGDGAIRGSETCDDWDQPPANGDGCDDSCADEPGFFCSGEPSICITVCGDGLVLGAETCDDADSPPASGDGCSSACQIETGYMCMDTPSTCSPICGNGAIHGSETCDDADSPPASGDGCSSTCQIETGYTCTGTPSMCNGICGDGLVRGAETCDTAGSGYFSVSSLAPVNCATREHSSLTGDDRAGIAVGSSRVLYSGDTSTASFQLGMLSTGAALTGAKRDGLVSDLASGQVYAFGNGATPISLAGTDGNFTSSFPFTISSLLRIDQTTGAVQSQITLSSPITVTRDPAGDFNGVFSGRGFVALYTTPDGGATNHVYTIDTTTGAVADLGVLPSLWFDIAACESWASWGIAEKIQGQVYLTYVAFGSSSIWRTRVSDGMTRGLSSFFDTNDMCSFAGSPATGRWYFHVEDASQFTPGTGEHIGYCSASFATTDPGCTGSCQTTAGYTCSGEPSVCTPLPSCGSGAEILAPAQPATTVNGYCVSPTQTVGQSFTVASSGKLVGIELGLDLCDAEPQDVSSIRLEVLRGAGVIASATLPAGFLPNLCLATTPGPTNPAYFDLSASCATVTASEQLVMRLTQQGYARCQTNLCVGGFFDGLGCSTDADCRVGTDMCVPATVGPSASSYAGGVLHINDAPNAALEDLFFKVFTRAP